jgi:flagellar biogenesis protein FliO
VRCRALVVGGLCAAILGGLAGDIAAQPARQPTVTASLAEEQPAIEVTSPRLRLPPRDSANESRHSSTRSQATASIWGTVGALVVVLGGLLIAAHYLRKHGPAGMRTLPSEAIEPLGQRLLSRGVTVHLLRCGSKVLLVAVGPDGARTLSEISDPVEVDLLMGACRRTDGDRPSFAKVFRRGATAPPPEPASRYNRPAVTEVDGV